MEAEKKGIMNLNCSVVYILSGHCIQRRSAAEVGRKDTLPAEDEECGDLHKSPHS